MYKLSKRSEDRLDGVYPDLVEAIKLAIQNSPFDFGIPKDGGLRTDKRQKELYSMGRTNEELEKVGITQIEGKPELRKVTWTLNSKHKPHSDGYGYAFDIYAYVGGCASWDLKFLEPIARHLIKVCKEKGIELEWGYDLWGKDGAHFQVKK